MTDITYEKIKDAVDFFKEHCPTELEKQIRDLLPRDFERRCERAYQQFLLTGKMPEI